MIYKKLSDELCMHELGREVKEGKSKEEITGDIIFTFSSFFKNKENLKRYSLDFLVHDWINYNKNNYEGLHDHIQEVVDYLNSVKAVEPDSVYKAFAEFQELTTEMGNKHWSLCILQRDLSELELFEYITEVFGLIENIGEVMLKVFLGFLVYIKRLKANPTVELDKVMKLSFGNIYNEFKTLGILADFTCSEIHNVPLTQWRNIACHKSYKVVGTSIKCAYGRNLDKEVVVEDKEELLEISVLLNTLSQIVNFATKFFLYDNIYEISPYYQAVTKTSTIRDETWQMLFHTELFTNGFELINVNDDGMVVTVTVQEMTDQDVKLRSVKASAFLFKLWELTNRTKVAIDYIDKSGVAYLKSQTTATVCSEIAVGKKEFVYLAEKAEFIRL
ncbi:hypothetical protein QBE53_10505 [Vallitaleaceae bacterium 9-2]